MAKISLQSLGRRAAEQRGERGIREAASEIGISAATLSRIERGYLPDLKTFSRICKWLGLDPGEVLGIKQATPELPQAAVHFRKDRELAPTTAHALAQLIIAAQRALAHAERTKK